MIVRIVGFSDVLQQTPLPVTLSPLSLITLPTAVADDAVMSVTFVSVSTVGVLLVVKLSSLL